MFLIDTDVVIDWLGGDEITVALMQNLRRNGIAISLVSHIELHEGVINARDRQVAERIYRRFLRETRMLVVGRRVADRAAVVRSELRRANRPVDSRSMDLLIAATAIEHRLVLVTRNVRDYNDIPAIDLYSW